MSSPSDPSNDAGTPPPVVRLSAAGMGGEGQRGDGVTARIQIAIARQPVRLEITVAPGPTRPGDLLPVFHGLTELIVGLATRAVEEQGKSISCCKGCGACCRQPVPISESEARALKQLVDAMPEPRRSEVRARFAEACQKVRAAGVLKQMRKPGKKGEAPLESFGLAYFGLGVACPFLVDESCSIHADRPVACREYLVTSDAAHCSRPSRETVSLVPLPAHVSTAVRALDRQQPGSQSGWVLLIQALEWGESHPDLPPSRTGPSLLESFFGSLIRDTKATA